MFDAAFWATAGTISPWAIISGVILAIIAGKLKPKSHFDELKAEHDALVTSLKEGAVAATAAHNLRVEQMTDAHNKAVAERREDHQKQIETITAQNNAQYDKAMEMANQQITWSVTRVNDWKDAYDSQNQALPLIAHSVEKLASGQEAIVAYMAGIKKVADQNASTE